LSTSLSSLSKQLLVLLAFVGVGAFSTCQKSREVKKVVNYQDFCLNELGQLRDKYDVSSFSFDDDAIREDFTTQFNKQLLDHFADEAKWDQNSSGFKELVRLQMIGAWRDRGHLNIANELGDQQEFSQWVERWKEDTAMDSIRRRREAKKLSDEDFCLLSAISKLFQDVTLHGSGKNQTVVLPLNYSKDDKANNP
jgi:hypothetical protein